jgi:hypothetical protein
MSFGLYWLLLRPGLVTGLEVPAASFPMARRAGMLTRLGFGRVVNMSDVDWLALWVEFAQATDNKQIEVAERIVYFDGRLDFTELSRSTLLSAARQIIRERVEKS